MIKIENLHKSFGKNEVLKGITTTIGKGEVVAIIGPSGSGKSTFFTLYECVRSTDKWSHLDWNGRSNESENEYYARP
ncbi:ATP-binding cassette domain-containing protein [Bacillus cereus]